MAFSALRLAVSHCQTAVFLITVCVKLSLHLPPHAFAPIIAFLGSRTLALHSCTTTCLRSSTAALVTAVFSCLTHSLTPSPHLRLVCSPWLGLSVVRAVSASLPRSSSNHAHECQLTRVCVQVAIHNSSCDVRAESTSLGSTSITGMSWERRHCESAPFDASCDVT